MSKYPHFKINSVNSAGHLCIIIEVNSYEPNKPYTHSVFENLNVELLFTGSSSESRNLPCLLSKISHFPILAEMSVQTIIYHISYVRPFELLKILNHVSRRHVVFLSRAKCILTLS